MFLRNINGNVPCFFQTTVGDSARIDEGTDSRDYSSRITESIIYVNSTQNIDSFLLILYMRQGW